MTIQYDRYRYEAAGAILQQLVHAALTMEHRQRRKRHPGDDGYNQDSHMTSQHIGSNTNIHASGFGSCGGLYR
jgi:hypothetical protein